MKSITSWLERKLFLKISVTKSNFLGFGFYKDSSGWKCCPTKDRKAKLFKKVKEVLRRKYAAFRPLSITFTKLIQIIRGWINYFQSGSLIGVF